MDTVIGTLIVNDEDRGETFTFFLVNGSGSQDNHFFEIKEDKLKIKEQPDYARSIFNIRVGVEDSHTLKYFQNL